MADGLTQTNKITSKSQRGEERDGAKPDGLTQTNEIASQSQKLERAREIQRELEEARESWRQRYGAIQTT